MSTGTDAVPVAVAPAKRPPINKHLGDERRAAVHEGGPQDHGHADRDPRRRHQHLLALRLPRRGPHLRLARPPLHHGAGGRHLLHGRAPHGPRPGLRVPHGGPLRGRHRRRLRAHDRPRVHRRGGAHLRARLPHLLPGGLQQLRHPPRLRLQLRLRAPARPPQLARHVPGRRRAARLPRRRRPRHAGVAALARHAGPHRRRAPRAAEDLRLPRRGRGASARHQEGGRHPRGRDRRRRRGRHRPRQQQGIVVVVVVAPRRGVEGAAHQPFPPRAPHARGGARPHVHPAGHGRGLRGDVQPAGVRAGGHQVQDQLAGRVHGGGRVQDLLHTHLHAAPGPHRPPPAAAGQRRRDDHLPLHAGHVLAHDGPAPRGGGRGTGRGEHRGHAVVRGVVRVRPGPRRLGLLLRDLPAAAARAGCCHRHGAQPDHERRHHHVLPLALQRHHHRRQLLPLRVHRRRRLGVHVLLPAGDHGQEPGGHREALRQGRGRRGRRRQPSSRAQ
ncbi:Polyol transporter protein 4 [Zea mays]|uniref:Polyol transporter protein 4 n=1 Tax=Zea mays TaxID=4577 RepID=A0A1D6PIC1_MAIZE|nr:Polyol transporter protein 4 [Zea mays]